MSTPSDAQDAPQAVRPYEWRGPSWKTRLFLLGVVVLAVGAVGLVGGLEKAPDPPRATLPALDVNESIDAGPWRVGVTNAAAVVDLGLFKPKTTGNYLLAVAVRVEILNSDSSNAEVLHIASLPEFTGLAEAEPLEVALIRDGSRVSHLNPGLPERVAYIFEVTGGTPVPREVVVELSGYTARRNSLNNKLEWLDPGPRARVTVPVDDKRETP